VSGTFIRETQDQQTTDILIDRLQKALNGFGGASCTGNVAGAGGCMYYNPFSNAYAGNPALQLTNPGYVSANANSPAVVGWLLLGEPLALHHLVGGALILSGVGLVVAGKRGR
jgi:hypothetical protein